MLGSDEVHILSDSFSAVTVGSSWTRHELCVCLYQVDADLQWMVIDVFLLFF